MHGLCFCLTLLAQFPGTPTAASGTLMDNYGYYLSTPVNPMPANPANVNNKVKWCVRKGNVLAGCWQGGGIALT